MKKVVIIGGGIAGMTAGILLQKAGFATEIYEKEMFFSSKLNGQTLTFWRDKERTHKEMLELSPEDEKEINKLMNYVSMAETMTVPVEKPFDAMNLIDFMKLGMSMKAMGKFAAWRIMKGKVC